MVMKNLSVNSTSETCSLDLQANSLQSKKNSDLFSEIKKLVSEERKITLEILHHLQEIESRRAFAELGYPSLFEYVVKDLGYSESATYRRIQAMRALKTTPELKDSIEKGKLTITAVSQVQTFF